MCDGGFKFNLDEREKMRELRVKHHVALHVRTRKKKTYLRRERNLIRCCNAVSRHNLRVILIDNYIAILGSQLHTVGEA